MVGLAWLALLETERLNRNQGDLSVGGKLPPPMRGMLTLHITYSTPDMNETPAGGGEVRTLQDSVHRPSALKD